MRNPAVVLAFGIQRDAGGACALPEWHGVGDACSLHAGLAAQLLQPAAVEIDGAAGVALIEADGGDG
ncbi:hypothetical protein D3C81_2080850 [compost metagenome]